MNDDLIDSLGRLLANGLVSQKKVSDMLNIQTVPTDETWIVKSDSVWETQAVKLPDNDYIEFRDASGNPVGALRWNEGKLKFYGNVESCAEKFGDYLATVMERKIQEEVNRRLDRINRYWDVCNDEEESKIAKSIK